MRPLFNTEFEQSAIGSMLIDENAVDDVLAIVQPSDFYQHEHVEIVQTIMDMRETGTPIDQFTVGDRLPDQLLYLNDMARNTPSVRNCETYANAVKDKKRDRDLIKAVNEVSRLVEESKLPTDKLVGAVQGVFESLTCNDITGTQISLKTALTSAVNKMDAKMSNIRLVGAQTGFTDIDKRLDDLEPGSLYIVAGRPSMGKTTYAMGVAKNVAKKKGKVLIFSLEMPAEQLATRMIADEGSIPLNSLRDASALSHERHSGMLMTAVSQLVKLNIEIDDQASLSVTDIRARARRENRKGKIELIIVDHIGLSKGSGKSWSKNDEIGEITAGLKALSKELGCPVMVLAQLNRKCEERPNKRPMLSDLRDSGNIEQDADVIQFIYRDEVYNDDSDYKGVAEIITAKYRDGEIGKDFLKFEGQYNRFSDLANQEFVSQAEDRTQGYQYYNNK